MFSKTLIAKAAYAVVLASAAGFAAAAPAPINGGDISVPSFGNRLANVSVEGNLEQTYFFNLVSDAGGLTASWNWDPTGPSNAKGYFYQSNAAGDLLGSVLGTFAAQNNDAIRFSYGAIAAGFYAFLFTADHGAGAGYSGQFTTYVPTPGVLALLGIGLAGLAATRRKSN